MNMGSSVSKNTTEWNPARYIDPDNPGDNKPFALLILNQQITDLDLFGNLWSSSSFRVCADGGANRLYDALRTDQARELMLPNGIVGDLDSLLPHVRDYYARLGVTIHQDADQDSTDLGKSLSFISRHSALQPPDFTELDSWRGVKVSATHPQLAVAVLGGFGGRVDHSLHSVNAYLSTLVGHYMAVLTIHALYVASSTKPHKEIALISTENITILLEPGRNIIHTPHRFLGKTCGLLPIGKPSIITTRGLEWDLKAQETRFGGLVSTSNHLVSDLVEVEASESIVFTMEIRREALVACHVGEGEV